MEQSFSSADTEAEGGSISCLFNAELIRN